MPSKSAIRAQPVGRAAKVQPWAGGPKIGVACLAVARLDGQQRRFRFPPVAGGLSTSSTAGDETHFCPVPLPRKTPSGGSLYWTQRNGRSPSLKVHLAAAWNER
jgi:hypothetical protein